LRYSFRLWQERTGWVKLTSYILVALSRVNGLTDRVLVQPGHSPPIRAVREFVVSRVIGEREIIFDSGAALSAIYHLRHSESEQNAEFRFRVTIKYYYRTEEGRVVTLRYDRYELTLRGGKEGVSLEVQKLSGLARTDPLALVQIILDEAQAASGIPRPINVSLERSDTP